MRWICVALILILGHQAQGQSIFSPPMRIARQLTPVLAVGDMNGDGAPDIVYDGTIAVNNLASLSTFTLIQGPIGHGMNDIVLSDIDGHNGKDALSANVGGIYWALSQDSTPVAYENIQIWNRLYQVGVAVGDMNGDGAKDIIAAGNSGPIQRGYWIAVFQNQSTSPSTFLRYDLPDPDYLEYYVAVADLNKDGRPDIVATSLTNLTWWENVTTQTLAIRKHPIASYPEISYAIEKPTLVDFDGDGDVDILISTASEVMWFENSGTTTPTFTKHLIFSDDRGSTGPPTPDFNITGAMPVDFNRDGHIDVVVPGTPYLRVLENTGDNLTFVEHQIPTPGADESFAVAVGDFNKDGYPDLAVSVLNINGDVNDDEIWVFLNQLGLPPAAARDWLFYGD